MRLANHLLTAKEMSGPETIIIVYLRQVETICLLKHCK